MIEEYADNKWGNKMRGRWSKKTGRVDIYFRYRLKDYIAEAKQYWPILKRNSSRSVIKETKARLANALEDARAIVRYKGERRVGILFVCPRISYQNTDRINDLLNEYLKGLHSWAKRNRTAIAWCFPVTKRKSLKHSSRYYPGQIILLRQVRNS